MLLDGVAAGRAEFVHLRAELEDGVHRALHGAGHVAGHVGHRHQVLVIDALVRDHLPSRDQLAQRHQPSGAPGDFQVLEALEIGAAGPVEPQHERHVFLGGIGVQQAGLVAGRRPAPWCGRCRPRRCRSARPSPCPRSGGTWAGRLPRTSPRPPRRRCASTDRGCGARWRCARRVRDRRLRPPGFRSTGGPGGTSATLMRAPYRSATGSRRCRTCLAISWLCSLRSPLGSRLTWMSATLDPRRR